MPANPSSDRYLTSKSPSNLIKSFHLSDMKSTCTLFANPLHKADESRKKLLRLEEFYPPNYTDLEVMHDKEPVQDPTNIITSLDYSQVFWIFSPVVKSEQVEGDSSAFGNDNFKFSMMGSTPKASNVSKNKVDQSGLFSMGNPIKQPKRRYKDSLLILKSVKIKIKSGGMTDNVKIGLSSDPHLHPNLRLFDQNLRKNKILLYNCKTGMLEVSSNIIRASNSESIINDEKMISRASTGSSIELLFTSCSKVSIIQYSNFIRSS